MGDKAVTVEEGWLGPGRRDGRIEPLSLSEDGLHIDLGKRGLYEWWYFDAHLDTGHTIVVFFHASNPNPGLQGKSGIEFVLLDPDGRRTQRFFSYKKSEFSADTDRPYVKIGRNSLKVEQHEGELPVYEINVVESGLGCHLRYAAEVNGWKPGKGFSNFGELGYFAWIVPFARASVTGHITVGDETIPVTGIGYHDHNWLNFQFQKIIKYWMWGRIYSEHCTMTYAIIQCNEKVDNHIVQVLMLADGQKVVVSTGEFDFTQDDFEYNASAKHHFPRSIRLTVPGEIEASLTARNVLEAQDLLDNYNPLLRFVARNLLRLKPGYFRLASNFELSVTRGGESRVETGSTLHEIVIFQPVERSSSDGRERDTSHES